MGARPRRGDLYRVDFTPARGVEQTGRRPALVVQNDRGNTSAPYTVVAAVSSRELARDYPFTVTLKVGDAGLARAGHINCSQLMTIDQGRLGARIGSLGPELMKRVDGALRYELGLES